ncbi:hypothetical protein [Nocardia sp. NPDC004750]
MRKDWDCDLPFLPVEHVEAAILDHYRTLTLTPEFIANITAILDDTVADRQGSVRAMHTQFTKRLKELGVKEERLLDLATDGGFGFRTARSRPDSARSKWNARVRDPEGSKRQPSLPPVLRSSRPLWSWRRTLSASTAAPTMTPGDS